MLGSIKSFGKFLMCNFVAGLLVGVGACIVVILIHKDLQRRERHEALVAEAIGERKPIMRAEPAEVFYSTGNHFDGELITTVEKATQAGFLVRGDGTDGWQTRAGITLSKNERPMLELRCNDDEGKMSRIVINMDNQARPRIWFHLHGHEHPRGIDFEALADMLDEYKFNALRRTGKTYSK